jgi:hypothetical protein
MADTALKISRESPVAESMDYQRLLQTGIGLCQQLAGDRWTDYNEHDPGVTILEQLCYALTDLAYRTHYDFEDILAERAKTGQPLPADTLYPGDRILTCNPLTPDDYRNLVRDRIEAVGNVWVQPLKSHPLGIEGLYEVFVEIRPDGEPRGRDDEARLAAEVRDLLAAHRNLAEDVERVTVLKPFEVTVSATVVADDDAAPADVLAAVLVRVQEGLVPGPDITPVDDALARGMTPEEVFEGPRLEFGRVDPASLKGLPREITVAQVRNAILSVPGVKRVKDLAIQGARNGRLQLDPASVPHLSPSIFMPLPPGQAYPIRIEMEGGEEFRIDRKRIWRELQSIFNEREDQAGYAYRKLEFSAYLKVERGEPRDIENYYSIQHHFPGTYGIGRYGVPENVGLAAVTDAMDDNAGAAIQATGSGRVRRLAQARQLKAYLLFFEQLLANYLAQLAHAPDLFSLSETLDRTYFALPIAHYPPRESDPPDVIDVLNSRSGKGARHPVEGYAVCIVDRDSVREAGSSQEILLKSQEVATEEEFRGRLAEILEAGSRGDNYQRETSLSGEIRLLLLNAHRQVVAYGEERFVTAEKAREGIDGLVDLLRAIRKDPSLERRHVTRVYPRRAFSVRVIDANSRVLLNSRELPSEEAREQRVGQILVSGVRGRNYEVVQHNNGEFGVVLRDKASHDIIAHGERRFTAREQADEERLELVRRLQKLRANVQPPDTFVQRLPDSSANSHRRLVEEYQQRLDELVKDRSTAFLKRRNRFLDHLLARFDEAFDNDALARLDPRNYWEKEDFYRELIHWKTEFLARYVGLSFGRGRGFDFSAPEAGEEEDDDGAGAPARSPSEEAVADFGRRSGLEQRLCLLLGLRGHVGPKQSYRLAPGPLAGDPEAACAAPGEVPGLFDGEGLYVLEHILLRPPVGEPGDGEPPADEFHSHRISVLLPSWPKRFGNQAFRYFAEGVLRDNCPAHVAYRCHWLDRQPMAWFETLYLEWLAVRLDSGADEGEVAELAGALKAFILWLEQGETDHAAAEPPAEVRQAVARVLKKRPAPEGRG